MDKAVEMLRLVGIPSPEKESGSTLFSCPGVCVNVS